MTGTGAGDGAIPHPHRRDRERAWRWAALHAGPAMSVWRLDAFKSALLHCESRPGSFPDPDRPLRAAASARLGFVVSIIVTAPLFLAWALRWALAPGLRRRLPDGARRLVAVHGELSTRTRHVLRALPSAQPPVDAILLLGRIRQSPRGIAALWQAEMGRPMPPAIVPLSLPAIVASLATWPRLMAQGWRDAGEGLPAGSLRERTAVAFRILHGAATAAWWRQRGADGADVVFGITGTGDTTLLERAIQAGGGRTLHAVHGQAVGPNFVGTSDVALFRSAFDASAYAALGSYGACTVQRAGPVPMAARAASGLLLLTNLAHPMNSGYQANGAADELALLDCAGEAARLLGAKARPLLWKPHPVLDTLPEASLVRQRAAETGFAELPAQADLAEAARTVRRVVTSPSTVALDLLGAGFLPLVVDSQGTAAGTALELLPQSPCDPRALADRLLERDDEAACAGRLDDCFHSIGPAAALELTTLEAMT